MNAQALRTEPVLVDSGLVSASSQADPILTPAQEFLRQFSAATTLAGVGISIPHLLRIAQSAQYDSYQLVEGVLAEPFVAQKVLSAANADQVRRGLPPAGTISRAMVLLGSQQVHALIQNTLHLENFKNPRQAAHIRHEFYRMRYAGVLARELSRVSLDLNPEEAYLCAMAKGFGRVTAALYLYPQFERAVTRLSAAGVGASAAATAALGTSFDQLTVDVLKSRGVPDRIVRAVTPARGPMRSVTTAEGRLGVCAQFCAEMVDAAGEQRLDGRHRVMTALLARFGRALHLSRRQLLAATAVAERKAADVKAGDELVLAGGESADLHPSGPITLSPTNRPEGCVVLGAGLAALTRMLDRHAPQQSILQHATDVLQRALGFHRAILAVKQPRVDVFIARACSGSPPDTSKTPFGFRLSRSPDLFNAALLRTADIYIRDASEPRLQEALPQWFRRCCPDARSFLLLCVRSGDEPIAFFYADHAYAGAPRLTREEAALVQALKSLVRVALLSDGALDAARGPAGPP